MSGSGDTAKAFTRFFLFHKGGVTGRIHFRLRRGENQINPPLPAKFEITLQVAGIIIQVFPNAELCGVNENGQDYEIAMIREKINQGKVSLVKEAHSGDQAYALPFPPNGLGHGAHLLDGGNNLHGLFGKNGREL